MKKLIKSALKVGEKRGFLLFHRSFAGNLPTGKFYTTLSENSECRVKCATRYGQNQDSNERNVSNDGKEKSS